MNLKVEAAKNVGSSWIALGSNLLIGFFLSPFILHRLGDEAFGVWVLIFSLSGYYGLFSLGIRSSIVRYVAHYAAKKDYDQLACTINTSLAAIGSIGFLVLCVAGVGSFFVGSLFRVSPQLVHSAGILFFMAGSAIALGFPLSVYTGILMGLQDFSFMNLVRVGTNMARAVLIVVALTLGGGLLTVSLITAFVPDLVYILYIFRVHRLIPLRYGLTLVDRHSLRQIVGFGSISFMIMVADRLRFGTDAAVIGFFLSSAAITFYSIGSKLVDYSQGMVDSLADIFLPMSSHFDATGDKERLRKIFFAGNRACALIMFPTCVALTILGKAVIHVWVGAKYVESGYWVLLLLLIPRTLYRAQSASNRILFGMNRHRALGIAVLIEGIVNLTLSIVFVHYIGIYGVALGTTIPLIGTSLFFLPIYLCRVLEVRLKTFLWRAYLVPFALSVPLAGVLWFMQHLFRAQNVLQLLAQLAAGGLVYGAGLLWFFFTKEPMGVELRVQFAKYLQQAFSR